MGGNTQGRGECERFSEMRTTEAILTLREAKMNLAASLAALGGMGGEDPVAAEEGEEGGGGPHVRINFFICFSFVFSLLPPFPGATGSRRKGSPTITAGHGVALRKISGRGQEHGHV